MPSSSADLCVHWHLPHVARIWSVPRLRRSWEGQNLWDLGLGEESGLRLCPGGALGPLSLCFLATRRPAASSTTCSRHEALGYPRPKGSRAKQPGVPPLKLRPRTFRPLKLFVSDILSQGWNPTTMLPTRCPPALSPWVDSSGPPGGDPLAFPCLAGLTYFRKVPSCCSMGQNPSL